MRVLFIFWANPGDPNNSTLTQELAEEFHRQGHKVTVVIPLEKKYKQETHISNEEYYDALYVKTGNFFNLKTKLEKVITTFTISKTLLKAILKYLPGHEFDLIITRAPFLADPKLVTPLKLYYHCEANLLLFDIFPQTAWDMGIIKSRLIYKYFKDKERKMLQAFSIIWCTSPGNARYMLEHNRYLKPEQLEWVYNYGVIKPMPAVDKIQVRKSLGYVQSDFIALFGGNMGVPQKLENILDLAREALILKDAKFLFIGVGTEKNRIQKMAGEMQLTNVKFIDYMPRDQYERFVASCDIGLVSLDERFSVPNFPSKTTDYFKLSLPILASLDKSAAKDYGKILHDEINGGYFALAGDTKGLFTLFKKLYQEPDLRYQMGQNGRKFYEQELDVSTACKKIVNKFMQIVQ